MQPSNNKHETRDRLLRTALNLYASQGLHGVSLRAISAASGSRNSAAMHYHFKNKHGVIHALMEKICEQIQRHASELQTGRELQCCENLHEALRVVLMPLVVLSRDIEWGPDAIGFIARILAEADSDIAAISNEFTGEFYREADCQLKRLIPELSDDARQLRLIFMSVNVFHGFADLAVLSHTPFGDLSTIDEDQLLGYLIDYLHNGLVGPTH